MWFGAENEVRVLLRLAQLTAVSGHRPRVTERAALDPADLIDVGNRHVVERKLDGRLSLDHGRPERVRGSDRHRRYGEPTTPSAIRPTPSITPSGSMDVDRF